MGKRTMPFWNDTIVPKLKEGKTVLVAAHGNSLRGIVCHLDQMTEEQIMELNLPTGIPFIYELDENMNPIVSMQFMGDAATVAAAIEKVKNQTAKKGEDVLRPPMSYKNNEAFFRDHAWRTMIHLCERRC